MPCVLLLMPTQTYRASAFLTAAKKLAFTVVVATERAQALAYLAPEANLTLPFDNPQVASDKIGDFSRNHPIDAVIAVDETTAVISAWAARALGLPGNTPEGAQAAMEKHRMRQILAGSSILSPWFKLLSLDGKAFKAEANQLRYPCVAKPLFLSSSRGVIRANNDKELLEACEIIRTILDDTAVKNVSPQLADQLLVEEYIPGEEVALEGILTNGDLKVLAIFDKPDPLVGPYFEETSYVTPSRHSRTIQNQIAEVAKQAAAAMGICHGPVHAELRLNDKGVWVVEIAARSIGGLCSQALRFEDNCSLEEIILRHAVGEDIGPIQRESLAAGVMMIPIPKAGVLRSVVGLERAEQVEGIDEIKISIPLTQKVLPMPLGNRYLGFIFASSKTASEVEKALRAAHKLLSFRID